MFGASHDKGGATNVVGFFLLVFNFTRIENLQNIANWTACLNY
jgi:hypothetical protein